MINLRRHARNPNKRPIAAELPHPERESWRRLPLDGAHNFRDLGGYRTTNGNRVKWGVIYRSDGLHRLTAGDFAYLSRLGIRTVVDFRDNAETTRSPDRPPPGVRHLALPIEVGGQDVRQEIINAIKSKAQIDLSDFLVDVGRKLVVEHTPVYRRWFRDLVSHESAVPQVFHCTAGKDRTGFAAALLLRILGVPHETVVEDYERSNFYLERFTRSVLRRVRLASLFRRNGRVLLPMMVADPRYLDASFAAIEEGWGGFADYISDGLGLSLLDVEALRDRLLEKARTES